jgi:hypothetical protein
VLVVFEDENSGGTKQWMEKRMYVLTDSASVVCADRWRYAQGILLSPGMKISLAFGQWSVPPFMTQPLDEAPDFSCPLIGWWTARS